MALLVNTQNFPLTEWCAMAAHNSLPNGKVSTTTKIKLMELSIQAGWIGSAGSQNPSKTKIAENAPKNINFNLKQKILKKI